MILRLTPPVVDLNAVNGLASGFFAPLTMTRLKGRIMKHTNVMHSGLVTTRELLCCESGTREELLRAGGHSAGGTLVLRALCALSHLACCIRTPSNPLRSFAVLRPGFSLMPEFREAL